jgi:HEAT repeat protein
MFNQETWRSAIAEKLTAFARHPIQEVQLSGTSSLLIYLCARTLNPFLDAFQNEPVAAVLALAELHRDCGADHLVRRAAVLRYQSATLLEREIRSMPVLRAALDDLLSGLSTIALVRQRLNSSRDEWLRATLVRELLNYDHGDFANLRRTLHDTSSHGRHEAIRALRKRQGGYTAADLVLLNDSLNDSVASVRAAAARMLGLFAATPPSVLVKALARVAIHDCDQETRYAAARALGQLRERIDSPQLLDQLATHLRDDDNFNRSSAALVLGQLGEVAGAPAIIGTLMGLLTDGDFYVREAAARALGRIGTSAATPPVFNALASAMEDTDPNVHEAAMEALVQLRAMRPPPRDQKESARTTVAA